MSALIPPPLPAQPPALPGRTEVDEQHPWLGLDSFTEELSEYFYGRSGEAEELYRRVRREPLTVLFGTSGLGKTSLLRAGLFPALRADGFLPVWVRLDHKHTAPPLEVQVKKAITEAVTEARVSQPSLPEENETLWEFFHRDNLHLVSWNGQPITPVLVCDQFEELFTIGARNKVARQRHGTFLAELADLIENRPPADVRERLRSNPERVANVNFGPADVRVVFSLREDYLANLEAYCEIIPSIARCRMRLSRMNGQQAFEAVVRPGADLVSEEVSRKIVQFVAAAGERQGPGADGKKPAATALRELALEPALLSLFCREINNQRIAQGLSQITADLVERSSQKILQNFYDACFAGQPEGARIFVEDELLTPDGHRDDIELQRAKEVLAKRGATETCLEELIDRRLLHLTRRGDTQRVELTHDVLAGVARDSRDGRYVREARLEVERRGQEAETRLLRERAEAKKKLAEQRRLVRVWAAATIAVFGVAVYAFIQKGLAEKAEREARRLEEVATEAKVGAQSLKASWRGIGKAREQLDLALLLNAEAFRRGRSHEAKNALLTSLSLSPHLTGFLRGHSAETNVRSLAFSPDGQIVASADGHGTIILWDPGSGFMAREPIPAHKDSIYSIAFSPDGRHLVSASADKTVRIVDVATGGVRKLGEDSEFDFREAAFSPDGKVVAAACGDGTVRRWSLSDGKQIASLRHHERQAAGEGQVNAVAFSPNGTLLISAGEDDQLVLWDLETATKKTASLGDGEHPVFRVAFSPDGASIATGSADGALTLWSVEKLERSYEPVFEHDRGIYDVEFSPDGKTLASASTDHSARLWDVGAMQARQGQPSKSLDGYSEGVYSIAFGPLGTDMLATGHADGIVTLWNLSGQPRLSQSIETVSGEVNALAFSADGKTVVAAQGKSIVLWDAGTRKWRTDALHGHQLPIMHIAISPRGSLLASASQDATIRFWDSASGKQLGPSLRGHNGQINGVAFSPRGDLLASASADGTIRLWKIGQQRPDGIDASLAAVLTGHTGDVMSVAFSPNGKTLASGSMDETVLLWNVAGRKRAGQLAPHSTPVFSVAFHPDDKRLAAGTRDGTVMLWDLSTRRPLTTRFAGHNGASVIGLAFHPNGKSLFSAGWRSSVVQWDLKTGDPTGPPLTGLGLSTVSLALRPDGRAVAAGSADTINILDLSAGEPTAQTLESALKTVGALALSHDGTTLAAGGSNGNIICWDMKAKRQKGIPLKTDATGVSALFFTPDDQMLGAVSKARIVFWNLATGGEATRLVAENDIGDVAFDPAGKSLAAGTIDGAITMWDWPSLQRRGNRLEGHKASVISLAYSGDGRWLFSSSDDRIFKQHDLSKDPAASNAFLDARIMRIASSPRANAVVLGNTDGEIAVYAAPFAPLEPKGALKHHKTSIRRLAFSPDGKMLASTSWSRFDHAITLFDIETLQPIGSLTGHNAGISGVVFSADGKALFSADDAGVILRWDLDPDSWQTLAASIAGRGFTKEEAQEYLSETSPPPPWDPMVLLKRADVAALKKDPNAMALFAEAMKAAVAGKDPEAANLVCWMGSSHGYAVADVVLPAGERAVELAAEDRKAYYRDTVGLARALIGKKQEAIADFRAFMAWAENHRLYYDNVSKRQEWIQKMERGNDPFTAETLRELRHESMAVDLE